MKATFELTTWLSENRELVINKYNKLSSEEHFNGISLKDFMIQVLQSMQMNNVKSANRAASMLPILMGNIYVNNSRIIGNDSKTDALRAKYNGTSAMSLV